jgi:hypothetical protein
VHKWLRTTLGIYLSSRSSPWEMRGPQSSSICPPDVTCLSSPGGGHGSYWVSHLCTATTWALAIAKGWCGGHSGHILCGNRLWGQWPRLPTNPSPPPPPRHQKAWMQTTPPYGCNTIMNSQCSHLVRVNQEGGRLWHILNHWSRCLTANSSYQFVSLQSCHPFHFEVLWF